MKLTQLELILTQSPRKNAFSQVEIFSVFYFKSARIFIQMKRKQIEVNISAVMNKNFH